MLTDEQLDRLDSIEVRIGTISGQALAKVNGNGSVITVNQNAGDYSWFVDSTPLTNEEFTGEGAVLQAIAGSSAADKVDLLTVIAREIGHALGYRYDDADLDDRLAALMSSGSNVGERIVIAPSRSVEEDEPLLWNVEEDTDDDGDVNGLVDSLATHDEDSLYEEWSA